MDIVVAVSDANLRMVMERMIKRRKKKTGKQLITVVVQFQQVMLCFRCVVLCVFVFSKSSILIRFLSSSSSHLFLIGMKYRHRV